MAKRTATDEVIRRNCVAVALRATPPDVILRLMIDVSVHAATGWDAIAKWRGGEVRVSNRATPQEALNKLLGTLEAYVPWKPHDDQGESE